jgi:hypothetical protein
VGTEAKQIQKKCLTVTIILLSLFKQKNIILVRRLTYLHIFFNVKELADDTIKFTNKIMNCFQELIYGELNKDNKEFYERYFFITKTNKRIVNVEFNTEAILKRQNNYAVFFVSFQHV